MCHILHERRGSVNKAYYVSTVGLEHSWVITIKITLTCLNSNNKKVIDNHCSVTRYLRICIFLFFILLVGYYFFKYPSAVFQANIFIFFYFVFFCSFWPRPSLVQETLVNNASIWQQPQSAKNLSLLECKIFLMAKEAPNGHFLFFHLYFILFHGMQNYYCR